MAVCPDGAEGPILFALVVYIPDPLAKFLDDLREELVPDCLPRAHVTILPPRPVLGDIGEALEHARALVTGFAPFDIVAGDLETFPSTDVIYINIKQGESELREVNQALTHGPLSFQDPFPYHPHITVAQDLPPERVKPLFERARERWAAFPHSRRIRVERACFVKSTAACTWVDLAEFKLSGVPVG